jgi:hypothetical protein
MNIHEHLEAVTEDENMGRHVFRGKKDYSNLSTNFVLNIFRYVVFLTNFKGK